MACENDKTGADARAVLLEAFHKFRAVGRSEPLSNDEPLLLWGVNNLVLPGAAQADLSKALPFPRASQQWGEEYENQAPITNAILQRCDPVMFARLRRRGNRNGNLIKREFNGRSNQRAGTAYGSLMLPSGDIIGGAPRFKPAHQSNRYKDYPLWEALSNNDLTVLTKHLDAHEAILVEDALAELKAMISPVKPMSSADTRHAIMAVCDLATGVSALSCNRDCAGAILNWLDVYCLNESHYDGLIKPHGIRSTDQMDLVFEVRQKIFDADSYLPHLPLNSSSRAPVAAPPFPVKLSSTAPLPPTPRQANTPQRNKARKKNALKNT